MPQVWIDIENPPQVQYLSPFVRTLRQRGFQVVLTARDYGETLPLLRMRGLSPVVVGRRFGRSRLRKLVGTLARALALARLWQQEKPAFLIGVSRSSVLAARLLRRPAFTVLDYEHVETRIFRLSGTHLFFPEVIGREVFLAQGFRPDRLHPFPGLKEDLSFAGVDLSAVPPASFGREDRYVRVLLRPPAEESHYFREEYLALTRKLLAFLASQSGLRLIYAPRYPRQREELHRHRWPVPPVVLERPIPTLPLLKGVDLVISSGGTMVREAAYLGVPAYSLFLGPPGGVDRYLEGIGRLTFLRKPEDFGKIRLERKGGLSPLRDGREVLEALTEAFLEKAGLRSGSLSAGGRGS